MARMDKCVICDYSENDGSGYASVNPGMHGRVRIHRGEPQCDTCVNSIADCLAAMFMENEEESGGS